MKRFSAPSAATGAKRPNTGFKVPFKVPFKAPSADAMVADSGAQPAASAAPKPIPPRAPGLAGASNGATFKKGFRPPTTTRAPLPTREALRPLGLNSTAAAVSETTPCSSESKPVTHAGLAPQLRTGRAGEENAEASAAEASASTSTTGEAAHTAGCPSTTVGVRLPLSDAPPPRGAFHKKLQLAGGVKLPLPVAARLAPPADGAAADEEDRKFYKVLYAKAKNCKRANKSFADGVLELRGDKCFIMDDEGKKVGETRTTLTHLKEDDTLKVGSWEVEVYTSVSKEDFLSGSVFMGNAPAPAAAAGAHGPAASLFRGQGGGGPMKALHVVAGGRAPSAKPTALKSLHSTDGPGALVLSTAAEPAFAASAGGKPTVAVVVDPWVCNNLRPHQRDGVAFMYECVMGLRASADRRTFTGALLADDMGLGKTLQCIALMWTLLKQGPYGVPTIKKVVVVCPATLVQNWAIEVRRWLGDERLMCCVVQGGQQDAKTMVTEWANAYQRQKLVLITSYEMGVKYSKEIAAGQAGLLICDEAHRLKKAGGNKTIDALNALGCRRRVLLTGTPVQNQLDEFYAMMNFACPDLLGPLAKFNRVFTKPCEAAHDRFATDEQKELGAMRSQELIRKTTPFLLRRTAEVNAKYLPAKAQYVLFCSLSPAQDALYRAFLKMGEVRALVTTGKSSKLTVQPLAAILALRQLCDSADLLLQGDAQVESDEVESSCSVWTTGRGGGADMARIKQQLRAALPSGHEKNGMDTASGKLCVLRQLLEAVKDSTGGGKDGAGDRVVIVSQWTGALDLISTMCSRQGLKCTRLDGSTPTEQRMDLVKRFNQGYGGMVFLLSTMAGGAGLNLIGANRLVLFDSHWNPANDLQAMGRVWRDGQKKDVVVYRLVATGSIEEKIYQRQLVKTQMAESVGFGGGESSNNQFSSDDLKDLFTYTADSTRCSTHDHLTHSAATEAPSFWSDVTASPPDPPLATTLALGSLTFIACIKPPSPATAAESAPAASMPTQEAQARCRTGDWVEVPGVSVGDVPGVHVPLEEMEVTEEGEEEEEAIAVGVVGKRHTGSRRSCAVMSDSVKSNAAEDEQMEEIDSADLLDVPSDDDLY